MTLNEMQVRAQAILSKNERTSFCASEIFEDGAEDLLAAIDAFLGTNGACVVFGEPHSAHGDNAAWPVQAWASLPIFIYDRPTVIHEPAGSSLVSAVVSALTDRRDFNFSGFNKFTNEKGGTLTVCEFTALIVFNG